MLGSCAKPIGTYTGTGTSSPGADKNNNNDANNYNNPNPPLEELIEPDKSLKYAIGWSQIIIYGNYAKTTVSYGAHFKTAPNHQQKEAWGVLSLQLWNRLTKFTNQSIEKPLEESDGVLPIPNGNESRYRESGLLVQLKTDKDKDLVTLFQMGYDGIYTQIKDKSLAMSLLKVVDEVIDVVYKEDA